MKRRRYRKPRRKSDITVRVMWSSYSRRAEAEQIARAIENVLKQLGYRIKKSRKPNRENDGGRIYFTITRSEQF